MKKRHTNEKGFTIVELMIALSVLSTILVMSSIIMIQIGALYSKGVNSASLQNASRNITADISQTLQFSGEEPFTTSNCGISPGPPLTTCYATSQNFGGTTVYAYCVGATRYSYVLNKEHGNDQATGVDTPHVLWRDTMGNSSNCLPVNMTNNASIPPDSSPALRGSGSNDAGYEMVPAHMRLTRFRIAENPLNSGAFNVDVWMAYGDSDLVNAPDPQGNTTCKDGTGTQFCALSKISSTVVRRLAN